MSALHTCDGCSQTIADEPEYVVTKRSLVKGKPVIETLQMHNAECFVLWSAEETDTQVCPINHPHCRWA